MSDVVVYVNAIKLALPEAMRENWGVFYPLALVVLASLFFFFRGIFRGAKYGKLNSAPPSSGLIVVFQVLGCMFAVYAMIVISKIVTLDLVMDLLLLFIPIMLGSLLCIAVLDGAILMLGFVLGLIAHGFLGAWDGAAKNGD